MPETNSQALKFHVSGLDADTGRVVSLDILKDRLIVQKDIDRLSGHGRALDPRSAYRAIAEGQSEVREELEAAAGLTLLE